MDKIGIMIGTHLFETIPDAYKALEKYGFIEGTCETYLVKLPEKVYNNLLKRTKDQYPC